MPFGEQTLYTTVSAVANVDLSTSQYYAVSFVNSSAGSPVPGFGMVPTAAGKACTGILQGNPVIGQAGGVQTDGITPAAIAANSTVVAGTTFLDVGTGGTLVPHASGTIVAQALESLASTNQIAIISVMLLSSNAVNQ